MSLIVLVEQMKAEILQYRENERQLLEDIAATTSVEFAEQAAKILDSRKHAYSFEAYLELLHRLKTLILNGVENCIAIDAVQTGYQAERILEMRRYGNE